MINIFPIFKRELKAYFVSPIAYVVFGVFLVLSGFFFYNMLLYFNLRCMQYMQYPSYYGLDLNITEMVVRPLFHNMSIIILLVLPMFTMRLFSEEKRSGTIELLLTAPVTDLEVVLGKYLASLVIYLIMLGLTVLYPVIMAWVGEPDWGPVISGYIGLAFMGASFLAVGLFTSSCTRNQIVAAVLSFGALLLFWVIGWSSEFVGPTLGKVFSYLSIIEHAEDFVKGIYDTQHIVFYLSFIYLALFLTVRVLESSKWRA